jgi:hypothetical protein
MNLHPDPLNNANASSYHISLKRTAERTGIFVSYIVCAPPSYGIEFNALDTIITSLPFTQSGRTRTTVHVDVKSSSNNYNLYSILGDINKIGNNLYVTSPTINLQSLTTSSNINRKNLLIRGNYLKVGIYSGLRRPDVSYNTIYVDASSNEYSTPAPGRVAYTYYVFTDASNLLIAGSEYSGVIDDILTVPPRNPNKFRAIINSSNKYDISYSQPLDGITEIANDSYNINFTIDNAFIPANSSYLPLPINKSSAVSLYDSRFHYGYNGKYYLFLNKYHLSDDAGVDYNVLLAPNSNIRQVSFRLNKKSQKSIELYMLDNSNNRVLMNAINLSDASNVNNLLDNLNVNDLSGNWSETSLPDGVDSAGVSLAALDINGMNGIRNLLVYTPSDRLSNKTLFIKRDDIFRVLSAVGQPVLRITNSGNIITPKVTTSMVSLLQQSVTTGSRDITYGSEAVSSGLFSEGALDFSGNWLQ